MLAWLRAHDSHPSASELHAALLPDMPTLSLATVYRNLEILAAEGEIEEVPSSQGATRYDGNVEPHQHYHCERCDRILDVDLPVPRGLERRLRDDHGLRSSRVRIAFFGVCPACEDAAEADVSSRREEPPHRGSGPARGARFEFDSTQESSKRRE